MMKRLLFAIAAALLLATAAYGDDTTVTETIRLRFLDAKSVPARVTTPHGIAQLTLNLNENSITVSGDRNAVTAFKTGLSAADVELMVFRVEMRLVRYHVDANGKVAETVLMTPRVMDLDGQAAMISVKNADSGYAIALTPHRDTDKTATLTVEVQELGEQGEVVRSGKNEQRVTLGRPTPVAGMTAATGKALRRAAQRGEVVTDQGAYTGYYVEAKTTIDHPIAR